MLHIKIIDSSKNEKIEISKAEKFLNKSKFGAPNLDLFKNFSAFEISIFSFFEESIILICSINRLLLEV